MLCLYDSGLIEGWARGEVCSTGHSAIIVPGFGMYCKVEGGMRYTRWRSEIVLGLRVLVLKVRCFLFRLRF